MTTAEHTLPEPHTSDVGSRLNWLRAGVLGANDGIVSTAGLVIGVAAAGTSTSALAAAGIAALAAGAVSMALGEYVSVSAQRDTEQVLVQKEALGALEHAGRRTSGVGGYPARQRLI